MITKFLLEHVQLNSIVRQLLIFFFFKAKTIVPEHLPQDSSTLLGNL